MSTHIINRLHNHALSSLYVINYADFECTTYMRTPLLSS